MYGEAIAEESILTVNKEIVGKLFSPLVRERNIRGLRWLKGVFDEKKFLLDRSTDPAWVTAVEDFRERLKEEFEKVVEKEDEAHGLIIQIATILGIKGTEKTSKREATTTENLPADIDGQKGNSEGTT
jgi:hypothetical protein